MKQSVPKSKVKDKEESKLEGFTYYGNGQLFSSATQFTGAWDTSIPWTISSSYSSIESTQDRLNDEINKLRDKWLERDNEVDTTQKKIKCLYIILIVLNAINLVLSIVRLFI